MPTYTPDEFARHLMGAIPKVARETALVVRRGALNIKADARRNSIVSSGRHARAAPYAIGFDDVRVDGMTISAEVGYESGNQAELGVLLEYGGGRDHSPPHHDLRRALEAEEPKFVEAMADAGEKALE
jgi:hypothetical protein